MDKFLTKVQVKSIIDGRPAGTDPKDVLIGLHQRGYQMEGLDNSVFDRIPQPSSSVTAETQTPEAPPAEPGLFSRIGTDLAKRNQDIVSHFANINPNDSQQSDLPDVYGNKNTILGKILGDRGVHQTVEALIQAGGDVAGGVGDVFSELIKSGINKIKSSPEILSKTFGSILPLPLQPVADKLAPHLLNLTEKSLTNFATNLSKTDAGKLAIDAIKKGGDAWSAYAQAHPEDAKTIEAIGNIINLGIGVEGTSPIFGAAKDFALGAGEAAINAGKDITEGTIAAVKNAPETIANASVDAERAAWAKPTTLPKGFNKASEIFSNAADKGTNIPDVLVGNKIKLSDNIENGLFNTTDTADKLRIDAGKTSSDILRPALQKADLVTSRTPVQKIIDSTIQDIKNSRGLTAGDMEAQIAKVKSEGEALARKYPKGMKLADMHDEKIAYSSNRYSPIGPKSDANAAAVDRAFGRNLAKTVEAKAPKEIPVKAFNAELQKQYQAADYLEALNGKKAPLSLKNKIIATTAKATGATLGSIGGLPGEIAGYHFGGVIGNMLNNMSNPVRDYFLNQLEKQSPAVFEQVKSYLRQP